MKRLALLLAALFLLAGGIANALPGLEDPPADFIITVEGKQRNAQNDHIQSFDFAGSMWDGGDREDYECAFAEVPDSTRTFVVANLNVERYGSLLTADGNEPYGVIADRGIIEVSDVFPDDGKTEKPFNQDDLCGVGHQVNGATYNGEDHFPHFTPHHPGEITVLYQGVVLARLDLTADECDRGYSTPGDQPGEAIVWWDEDGPENDGHGALACNGGGQEPVAVARIYVEALVEGVTTCVTDDIGGDICGPAPGPEPMPIPGGSAPSPSPSPSPTPSPCVKSCSPSKG